MNTGSESHPSRTTAHGLETNKYSGGDIRNPVSTTSGNRLGATGAAGMAGSVVALPAVSDEVPSENRLGNTGVAGIGGNSGTVYGYQTNKGMSPSGSSVLGTTAHGYETNKYAKDVDHPTAMGGSSENRMGATGAAGVAAAAVGVGGVGAYEASKEGEGDDISRATYTERSYPLATHSDSSNVLTAGDAGLPGRPRAAGATGPAISDTSNKLTAADVGLPGRSTGTGATDTLNTSTGTESSSGGVSSGTTALYGLTPLGAGAAAAVAGGTSQSAGTTSADPLSSQPIDSEGRYAPGHPTESSANREVDSYALDSANAKQAATVAMAGGAGGAASSSQHESSMSGDRFFGRPPSSPPATQSTFSDRDALTAATVATGTGAAGAAGYDRYEHTTERAQLPVATSGQPASIPQRYALCVRYIIHRHHEHGHARHKHRQPHRSWHVGRRHRESQRDELRPRRSSRWWRDCHRRRSSVRRDSRHRHNGSKRLLWSGSHSRCGSCRSELASCYYFKCGSSGWELGSTHYNFRDNGEHSLHP